MDIVDTKVDINYKNGGIGMEKIPNAVYTKEFREEAVRMVLEHSLSTYMRLLRTYRFPNQQ
jgi:transposase-like protein